MREKAYFQGREPARAGRLERLTPWLLPALGAALWVLASEIGWVPVYLLPPPGEICKAGYAYVFGTPGEGPYAGRFLGDAAASLVRVTAGFSLAVVFGVPLGLLSGRVEVMQRVLANTVNALRAVPGICWLPLAMVWFGIGLRTTVFLVGLAAFFPIFLNTDAGARQLSPLLLQAGAMMGVSRLRGVFRILIPGSMPHIVTGLRLGLGISWAYLVLGELTGVPDGLGAVIMDARMLGRMDMIVVGILLIAVLGRFGDRALTAGMRMLFKSARRLA